MICYVIRRSKTWLFGARSQGNSQPQPQPAVRKGFSAPGQQATAAGVHVGAGTGAVAAAVAGQRLESAERGTPQAAKQLQHIYGTINGGIGGVGGLRRQLRHPPPPAFGRGAGAGPQVQPWPLAMATGHGQGQGH